MENTEIVVKGFTFKLHPSLNLNKQHILWNGASIVYAESKFNKGKIEIYTEGEVKFEFLSYKKGRLFSIEDGKGENNVSFNLSKYINSDEELEHVLNDIHGEYYCRIEGGKRWNAYYKDFEGTVHLGQFKNDSLLSVLTELEDNREHIQDIIDISRNK